MCGKIKECKKALFFVRRDDKMYKRVLAIGDIHGNYKRLINLWDKINFNDKEDFLVFLGDYIDRGKDSIKVLEFVMNVKNNNKNVRCLMGNHELMFTEYYTRNGLMENNYEDWVNTHNGGDVTLKQFQDYMIRDRKKMNKLIDFIHELDVYNEEIEGFFFSHAGLDQYKPIHEQTLYDLLWIREECFEEYDGELTVVIGHTPTEYFNTTKPIINDNNVIMLDTGAYLPAGKLTCMDVLTGNYWQS